MPVRSPSIHAFQAHGPLYPKGFTLIELMVVVAIMAILAALAGPSFRDLIEGWRVRSAVEEINSTIYFARSEAIKRGGRVSVASICNSVNWTCGWRVFTDADSNGVLNPAAPDLDIVLQTFPQQTGININNAGTFFTLDRWGQLSVVNSGNFAITVANNASSRHRSALCLTLGGRIKTTKGTTTC